MNRGALTGMVLSVVLVGARAGAQPAYPTAPGHDVDAAPATRTPTDATAPSQDFRANAGLGAFSGDTLQGGVASALLATYRFGPVEAGATLEGGSEILGGEYGLMALVAGPVWRSAGGFRVELLGVLGQDRYSGVGCGMFCESGGASATLPYGGARAGASYAFGKKRTHVELGGSVFYGSDLEKKRVRYTTTGGLDLDLWGNDDGYDDSNVDEHETTLGGERMGAMVTIGVVVDG